MSFLAELNGLDLKSADVGNAYLTAYTKEAICFKAGPEFGPLEGHTFAIQKALYGLRSSGARFHEKFADTLRSLGFTPSLGDPDLWYRDAGDCYEYVVTWVDDLLAALKPGSTLMDDLQADPWNYKLKGVGDVRYHLGGNFHRDKKDGTLCYNAQTYVDRMVANYRLAFGKDPPKKVDSPLPKGDHPELDTSPFCSPDQTAKFQSLIGALQWTISLCRFDIANAVMTLSRFRAEPRIGHLDRAQRIVGYLWKRPHGTIRFRTGIPDHESVFGPPKQYDWMNSIYGKPSEPLHPDFPPPKGKLVRTSTFVDANLLHDCVTGRSATGILHFLNQTPIDWFSKRQAQVETATYGSEFVAARTAVEQIMDLRFTLRSLGVCLDEVSWMFGDNQSVITSSTIPHSTLSKRWNALSYHRVREAVASGFLRFEHLHTTQNCADSLTKSSDWATVGPFIECTLFSHGDTNSSQSEGSDKSAIESVAVGSPTGLNQDQDLAVIANRMTD